jgi:2-keto-4-pentenoate hydratase/2-oxohepta-3-ene-1,7-dioic acid hydratase in catechol pathway
MKLVTFHGKNGLKLGAINGDRIVDLTAAKVAKSMIELIAMGPKGLKKASAAVKSKKAKRRPLAGTRLASPIPRPGKILCSGINYKSHAEENPNAKMPSEPFFFAKMPSNVIGHEDVIPYPKGSAQLDYEVEFSAVIGKRLSRATEAEIMPALFGYTLLHDVSARDVQFKDNQITLGKNFDGFCPIGPCIVTADEMTEPDNVRLMSRLNGKTMQDGTTADWLFSLPRLISFLSQVMALEPGDVVSTGTPAGVGLFQKPPVFMQVGDVVEIEAEGIGVLRNRIGA